mmetsp:Transcript_53623/g.160072  ORF Transcript_53623/g.160072 Transcript_53623/m.160072 type:complete len:208 (-) Transcript_53623:206-829(-)
MYSSSSVVASIPVSALEKLSITDFRCSAVSFMSAVLALVGSSLFLAMNKAVCFSSPMLRLPVAVAVAPSPPAPPGGATSAAALPGFTFSLMYCSKSSVASMPIFSLTKPSITTLRSSELRAMSITFALLGSNLFLEMKIAQFRSSVAGPAPCAAVVTSCARAGDMPFPALRPGRVRSCCCGSLGSGIEESGGGAGAPASFLCASMRT